MPPEIIFVEPSGAGTRLLTSASACQFLSHVATFPTASVIVNGADHLETGAKVHDVHVSLSPKTPDVPPLPPAAAVSPSRGGHAVAVPALFKVSSFREAAPPARVFRPAILNYKYGD